MNWLTAPEQGWEINCTHAPELFGFPIHYTVMYAAVLLVFLGLLAWSQWQEKDWHWSVDHAASCALRVIITVWLGMGLVVWGRFVVLNCF